MEACLSRLACVRLMFLPYPQCNKPFQGNVFSNFEIWFAYKPILHALFWVVGFLWESTFKMHLRGPHKKQQNDGSSEDKIPYPAKIAIDQ